VCNAASEKTAAKRLLREIRFLRHLRGHPNVVSVEDVVVRRSKGSIDVYIVTELMEADLEQIIKSSQALSNEHVRCLIFQLMNGIRHMHHAGIVHRDLKPANCVVDSQCRLKVCDLGLSRHVTDVELVPEGEDAKFTDYVVTRWYRAPELLMGNKRYTTKVDMWAVGCVLAELIGRRPIFPGDDTSDMLVRISSKMGKPSLETIAELGGEEAARNFVSAIPPRDTPGLPSLYLGADSAALELLGSLLTWSVQERAGIDDAMASRYVRELHEAPRVLQTNHLEMAVISHWALPSWKILDLICMEGASWQTRGAHCRVASKVHGSATSGKGLKYDGIMAVGQDVACSCGMQFSSGSALLAHLAEDELAGAVPDSHDQPMEC
jgi:mitogen-activated protein kinase 1/3